MKYILGKKLGMTQIFADSGRILPVTRVLAGPCQVTQIQEKSGKIQLGFGKTVEFRLKKPQLGHLKGLEPVKILREVKVENITGINKGDFIDIETFAKGDKVTVCGISKGKGFQGVVKRHGFSGSKATHGNKDQLRASGAIGSTGPQKVFKGLRMAGRMGGDQITVKNLEIVEVNLEKQEIYVKGAVPGARNGFLIITGEGNLKIKTTSKVEEVKVEEEVKEEIPTEIKKEETSTAEVVESADTKVVVDQEK